MYMTTVWNKPSVETFSISNKNNNKVPALLPIREQSSQHAHSGPKVLREGFNDDDEIDNIKDFGTPETAPDVPINEPTNADTDTNSNANANANTSVIKEVIYLFFMVLLSIHVAYTWYNNLTQGVNEAIVYKKAESINVFPIITGYLFEIIKFIDTTVHERFPYYIRYMIDNSFFKDRTLFILLIGVGSTIVKYLMDFGIAITEQMRAKKLNIKKLPGPNALYSLLYFGVAIYGLIRLFTEGGSYANFIALNPIISMICIIILVAVLYVPTISALPIIMFIYVAYYSLIGKTAFNYETLNLAINSKHVLFEFQEDSPVKNALEQMLRTLFKYLPHLLVFMGLVPVLIKTLDIHNAPIKYSFIGIIVATFIGLILKEFINTKSEAVVYRQ